MSDKKCCVIFNEEREHTLTAGPGVSVRLIPGRNIVSVDTIEKVSEKNQTFKNLVDEGVIEILPEEAVKTDAATGNDEINVSVLSAKEVKTLVEAEFDIDVLNGYKAQETQDGETDGRPSVMKAIDAQIEALEKAAEAEEETE